MMKFKKAKQKWFNKNIIEFHVLYKLSYDNVFIVKYSKLENTYKLPYSDDYNIKATQYKLSKLKPYEVYFLLRRCKDDRIIFSDIRLKHSIV